MNFPGRKRKGDEDMDRKVEERLENMWGKKNLENKRSNNRKLLWMNTIQVGKIKTENTGKER